MFVLSLSWQIVAVFRRRNGDLNFGSDKQTGEGADPKRVAAVPADPGNVTVFRRDPADGSLTPTGAQWTAPHVMSAQAAV